MMGGFYSNNVLIIYTFISKQCISYNMDTSNDNEVTLTAAQQSNSNSTNNNNNDNNNNDTNNSEITINQDSNNNNNNNTKVADEKLDTATNRVKTIGRDLFIKNLHPSTTDRTLRILASRYGRVTSCRVITYKNTNISREIAYLSFAFQSDAQAFRDELNGCLLDSRYIVVDYAEKYTNKKDFLFPQLTKEQRQLIQMDGVAEYSVSDAENADSVSKIMLKFIDPNSIITDANSCVGGNSMSFARYFSKVHSIELDTTRYKYLVNNITVAGYAEKIITYNESYLDYMHDNITQDAIFFDPPCKYKTIRLSLFSRIYCKNANM
jgi:RNA recognition motif-containing protein